VVLAPITNRRMTFEELEQLPESHGFRQELHHGELVEVPAPKFGHYSVQLRLRDLILKAAGDSAMVGIEFGFKPLPQFEYWIADVAYTTLERAQKVPRKGYFEGVPELVVEVLSPSNSSREMRERRKICLANGAIEFWIVDEDNRELEVTTPEGRFVIYKSGQQVPLFFALNAGINDRLEVAAIFD
jgi:Uma2 family endonuclease